MLEEHLGYVADRIRLERFRIGIAKVIRPGDHVADLGCGSGILGLLCLRAGGGREFRSSGDSLLNSLDEMLRVG